MDTYKDVFEKENAIIDAINNNGWTLLWDPDWVYTEWRAWPRYADTSKPTKFESDSLEALAEMIVTEAYELRECATCDELSRWSARPEHHPQGVILGMASALSALGVEPRL